MILYYLFYNVTGVVMELITSKNNPKVVRVSKLLQKKYRGEYGEYIVCGKKLTEEASLANMKAESIFVTDIFFEKNGAFCRDIFKTVGENAEIYKTSCEVMKKMSGEESPDGILCVFKCTDNSEKISSVYSNSLCNGIKGGIVILDSVRDPGNMGTAIRSAYAFGIGLVIASPDCADIYSPKVQRGAMGASFGQSVMVQDTKKTIKELKDSGFSVYAAALHQNSADITDVKIDEKTAFVIGNEGSGLSSDVISLCSGCVIIPIKEHSESLNAAVAASIIMWEMGKSFG